MENKLIWLWIVSCFLIWIGGAIMFANDFYLMYGILGNVISLPILALGLVLNLISLGKTKITKNTNEDKTDGN